MVSELGRDFKFHHLGIAAKSLENSTKSLEFMGYVPETAIFEDHTQGVRGQFLVSSSGPRFEVLENLEGSRTLSPWIARGVALYHTAYEVDAFDDVLAEIRSSGGKVLVAPVPAVAFDGRRICFVALASKAIVEIIEC